MTDLDLLAPVDQLTRSLVDIESVSGNEQALADGVEAALRRVDELQVWRDGNAVVAERRVEGGPTVILAGHLDTVPVAGNLPSTLDGNLLWGCGTTDMKGGVAVALRLAATLPRLDVNVRYVFYDLEEVDSDRNGLARLARNQPAWLAGDFAVLLEPTDGVLEGGCQGSLRVSVPTAGRRAHTARAWMGSNAIQEAAPLLERLRQYEPRIVDVDGLTYREGLQAVRIEGGVAGNVVPDACQVSVNHRYAPDRTADDAVRHLEEVFDGYPVTVLESAPAARPHMHSPYAQALLSVCSTPPRAKLGWTDVARFAELGIPAVNFGPGDPQLAHAPDEHVDIRQVGECEAILRSWITGLG